MHISPHIADDGKSPRFDDFILLRDFFDALVKIGAAVYKSRFVCDESSVKFE